MTEHLRSHRLFVILAIAGFFSVATAVIADPSRIILDTDMSGDCDDAGAMAVLHALADRGECELIAVVTNRKDKTNASAAAVDAINTYYGRPGIPIGTDKVGGVALQRTSSFAAALRDKFPHRISPDDKAPDALAVYQQALTNQPDGSVTICSIGAFSNLAELCRKSSDLVRRKVKRLVVMGGGFPKSSFAETNAAIHPAATQFVADKWPTEIVWHGFEVGNVIITGARLKNTPASNPVRVAYELKPFNHRPAIDGGQPSWDQAAALYAVRGPEADLWEVVRGGRVRVDERAFTVWDSTQPGQQAYVKIKDGPQKITAIIENLMAQAPAGNTTLWQPFRITPRAGTQHMSLDGEWQLSWRDNVISNPAQLQAQTNAFPAQVPSTVQMALYRTGKFPAPYKHLNSKLYEWVDEKIWYYQRSFDIPQAAPDSHIFLCFDGIDYFSRVWINGVLLGQHEGMFGGPMIDVSSHLKRGGKNNVVVEVKAGNHGTKKTWKYWGPEGSVIKPWVIAGGLGGEMFFPLGIWQGVRLEIVPRDHLERPFLTTLEANDKAARLSLSLEILTGTNSQPTELHPWKNRQIADGSRSWVVPPETQEKFSLQVAVVERDSERTSIKKTFPLHILEGRNFVKQELYLPKPQLWWPNGMGSQPLYTVKLTLIRDGKETDSTEFDYGIRTIETKPTAGPRTSDRWANWQFVINGRPIFVKGMNWMPADILLDLPRERYQWLLGAARAAGIQLLRVWGGGLIETEEFYKACNELGIMVWQDFPIGNRATPEWPQDVWEAQVMQTIFRLRNHPSLALWCGGNEFNPYATGNATSIGIFERCVADFDPTRPMRRTSPDGGSLHTYPDMDPTWYGQIYRLVPFLSETGMHSIPDPSSIREVVKDAEVNKPLTGMLDKKFPAEHPELMHHFVEYQASRVPRMLSRASHISDMRQPTLEALSEGTQIGAGEFYQIVSEQMQANYPVTAGLMPWVFKRPWPVIAIMLVDGFGHPTAPYYFLKRTYEPTHVMAELPWLIWGKAEKVSLNLKVLHSLPSRLERVSASIAVYDDTLTCVARKTQALNIGPGPCVTSACLGEFEIPQSFEDRFFFIVAELRDGKGKLTSRSVYWPRCLRVMSDKAFQTKYRTSPQPSLSLDNGPWLKPQVQAQQTTLKLSLLKKTVSGSDRMRLNLLIRNTGPKPAFLTKLNIEGATRAFYSSENFFWLAPGEEKQVEQEILWREPLGTSSRVCAVEAWNASADKVTF